MRKHVVGASNLFAADIVVRALNFVTVVWLADKLAPHAYGLVVIGASVLDYALLLCDWGLKTVGAREAALAPEARRFQPSQIAAARSMLSIAVFVVANVLISVLPVDATQAMIVRVYLLGLLPYAALIDWYHQGLGNFATITYARAAGSVVLVLGAVVLVGTPGDAVVVPWLYVASLLTTSAVMLLAGRSRDRIVPRASDFAATTSVLATSGAVGVAALFGQSFLVLPAIVVGELLGPEPAGVLYATLRIVAIVLIVDRVFGALYLPALARSWSADSERSASRLHGAYRVVSAIGIGASAICVVFAGEIIDLVYGERYADGARVLALVAPFVAATLINTFLAYGLVAIGEERLYRSAAARSGALFVILLLALTYAFGLEGAAVAMVAGELVMTMLLSVQFARFVSVRPARPLLTSLIVATALIAIAQLIDHTSLWQLPLYALAFIGTVYALGGVALNDLRATPR